MKGKSKNTKSTKSTKTKRRGKRKYNWFQIIAYILILLLEEAWNFIMHPSKNESKVKSFLLRTGWSVVNLYACAIIIAHPFILDYGLLYKALYSYLVMAAVSFILGPKESARYIYEIFKDIKDDNNSYDYLEDTKRKSVIIDIKEYRDKKKDNQVNNNNNDDDIFYHYR